MRTARACRARLDMRRCSPAPGWCPQRPQTRHRAPGCCGAGAWHAGGSLCPPAMLCACGTTPREAGYLSSLSVLLHHLPVVDSSHPALVVHLQGNAQPRSPAAALCHCGQMAFSHHCDHVDVFHAPVRHDSRVVYWLSRTHCQMLTDSARYGTNHSSPRRKARGHHSVSQIVVGEAIASSYQFGKANKTKELPYPRYPRSPGPSPRLSKPVFRTVGKPSRISRFSDKLPLSVAAHVIGKVKLLG